MEEKALDAHYAYRFKGIRLDPYRIMQVYKKITHPAHQHAFKKLLRAGESVKPLKQDIREVIMTLERWLEMIEEEEVVEKELAWEKEKVKESAVWEGIKPNGGLIYPYEGSPKNPVFKNGGIVYCSDFNQHSKSTPPILTGHDPEKTLAAMCHLTTLQDCGVITANEAARLAGRPLSNNPEDDVLKFSEAGSTNRLKPVEDKAEVKEGCSMSEYLNRKWLEDAYDEPTKDDLGWFDREKFKSRLDEGAYDVDVPPATGWVRI